MNKILLLLLICKNVLAGDDSSNEKYIDLLPEEEKQEFLNKIARRILEGIKSNDTPNESHADITDDQLDAHEAFVQEILKEESDNLRNEKKTSKSKEADETDRVDTNRYNENDRNGDKMDSNIGDKEDHIDLTLREGKRHKRTNDKNEPENETIKEILYDVIPVKTVYDQLPDGISVDDIHELPSFNENSTFEIEQKDNLTSKSEEIVITLANEQKGRLNNKESGAFVSDLRNSNDVIVSKKDLKSDSLIENSKIENSENLRKSYHNKLKIGTTVMTDFEPNLNESYTTADYNISYTETPPLFTISKELTENSVNDEDNWVSTQKIYDNGSEEKELEHEEISTVHNLTNINVTETVTETFTTSFINFTSSSMDESTIIGSGNITYPDSHKLKAKFVRSMSGSLELKNMKNSTVKSIIETASVSNPFSSIDNSPFEMSVSEIKTDTENLGFTKASPTKNVQVVTSKHVKGVLNIDDKDVELATEGNTMLTTKETFNVQLKEHNREGASLEKAQNKTILRARLDDFHNSEIDENALLQKIDDGSSKVKIYEVFEVDPKQPHFATTGKPSLNEHPVFVPVYNYASDNAYFRPHNKFGPNVEDMEDIYYKDDLDSIRGEDSNQLKLKYTRSRFSGYHNNKKRGNMGKNVRYTNQLYKKQKAKHHGFIKPVTHNLNQEINYNPGDYADLDYYYGRILRRGKKYSFNTNEKPYNSHFPNSNEEEHPMTIIHKSDNIKDHVRAVRNILYLQTLFGYVPQVREKVIRKANQLSRGNKTKLFQEISMDYYFDKTGRKHKIDTKNKLFTLNKSKFKQMTERNIPQTPNPVNFESDSEKIPDNEDSDMNLDQQGYINEEISKMPFKKLFNAMIVVLKDSIKVKNEKLVKYDWLKTTVNIQAALRKLLDLIEQLKYGKHVHSKDIELIKYTMYLFELSKTTLKESLKEDLKIITDLVKRKKNIIKFPRPRPKTKIKEPIKLWMHFATYLRSEEVKTEMKINSNLLSDFEGLLQSLLLNLNDLHDAIKQISMITEYKNQNWLQDINDTYIEKGSRKNLAKIILHLSLSRLLDLIEDSSQGVEVNFRSFVKKNRLTVMKSKEECLFVLKVLEELNNIDQSNNE